jgi:ribonuclease HII
MIVCGMDEVGRGCIAGPLVAAATVLNTQCSVLNLKDSKKLTSKQRERIYQQLLKSQIIFAVEFISVEEINQFGIGWANKEVFKRLSAKIAADVYIADGNLKIEGVTSVVKADSKIPEVMAASIIAKVTRDKYMSNLHNRWVKYCWHRNKGYGTALHLSALRRCGPCKHHRKLFVRKVLKSNYTSPQPLSYA